jgi:hypothetical protein
MVDRPRARPRAGRRAFVFEIERSARTGIKPTRPMVDRHRMSVLAPLRIPAFRRLATSYACNELAWAFSTVALAVLVFDRTGSSLATTTLFLATAFVPALAAPALAARLDLLPVRRALPALYLTEAAIFAALAVISGRFLLPAVLALALVDGAAAITARALTRAAVAATLKPSDSLEDGNQVLNLLFSVAFAAGPAMAAVVVAMAGVPASLAITATLFLAMALVLATSRSLPPARGDADRSWRRRLSDGLGYVRAHPVVRRVLQAHVAALSSAAAVVPVEVVYAKQSLGGGDAAYGLLLAAWGAGTVGSSVVLARVTARSGLLRIPLSAAAIGSGYVVMALAPSLPIAMVGCFIGGVGNGVYFLSVTQALQDRIADDYQARVMSLLESATAASYGVGFILGGAVAALADPRAVIGYSGAGVLVAAAAIVALLRGNRRVAPGATAPLRAQAEPAA